jgi:hypothetical protein
MGQQVVFNYPMLLPTHPFICEQNWLKNIQNSFLMILSSITSILLASMFYGPTSGVHLSHSITQGTYYTHDPIYLSYGLLLPLICNQKWPKIVEKHVFGNVYVHNLLFCTQRCSMGQ